MWEKKIIYQTFTFLAVFCLKLPIYNSICWEYVDLMDFIKKIKELRFYMKILWSKICFVSHRRALERNRNYCEKKFLLKFTVVVLENKWPNLHLCFIQDWKVFHCFRHRKSFNYQYKLLKHDEHQWSMNILDFPGNCHHISSQTFKHKG